MADKATRYDELSSHSTVYSLTRHAERALRLLHHLVEKSGLMLRSQSAGRAGCPRESQYASLFGLSCLPRFSTLAALVIGFLESGTLFCRRSAALVRRVE